MQQFTTRARTEQDHVIVEFEVDGAVLSARKPKSMAFLDLASVAESTSPTEQLEAVLGFMEESLLEESWAILDRRLHDPDDEFDFEDLTPIIDWLTSQFSERPTGRPAASSRPRKRTGPRSTAGARSTVKTPEAGSQIAS